MARLLSSVGCMSAWYSEGQRFDPRVRQNTGHEIVSTAILSLPLIQVAVLSYWRKDVHLVLVDCLGSLPRNSVDRLTDGASSARPP